MEVTIPAGCAVALVVDGATFRLRTLAEARFATDDEDAVWSVPVMVAGEALGLGEGRARFVTHVGLMHVPARLVATDDGLVLEGLGTPRIVDDPRIAATERHLLRRLVANRQPAIPLPLRAQL